MCCKLGSSVALVTYRCDGCGQSADSEEGIKHGDKDHEKKIVKVCALSGTFPHGGVPREPNK